MASVSDIVHQRIDEMHRHFYAYCEVAMEARVALDNKTAALADFLISQMADPTARGLPVDAFILAPIQRLARLGRGEL